MMWALAALFIICLVIASFMLGYSYGYDSAIELWLASIDRQRKDEL